MVKIMAKQTKELKPRIKRGQTELIIPHKDNYVTFIYPGEGPNTYRNVFERILERNLRPATGKETASLVYSVYCDKDFSNEPEAEEIRNIMRNRWLWTANRNFFTDKGVYVIPDPEAKGLSEKLDINELEKMLKNAKEVSGVKFSEDGKVRFAPKDTYKLENNTSEQLAENEFIIANYGKEGAEQLSEVSNKFPSKPYVYGLYIEEGNNSELRVSALGDYNGNRLYVSGGFDDSRLGHSFGVLK